MNFRTTLILLILLTGGLLFVYFVNRGSHEQKPSEAYDPKGAKLFDINADDVNRVTLTPAGAPAIEMEKQQGKWMLTKPIEWPASGMDYREETPEFTVNDLVQALSGLRSHGHVDLTSDNAATTGFDKPRYTVELTDKNGKTVKLQIGNRSALGSDLYVKPDDKNVAELVGGSKLAVELDKSPEKLFALFRAKQLIGPVAADIKQLSIEADGKKLVLHKIDDNWQIVEPQRMAADNTQVSDVLMDLTGLKADEFVNADSPESSAAQFDHPKLVAWISTQAPSTQPATTSTTPATPAEQAGGTTITIGQFTDVDRNRVFVKVSHPSAVAESPIADTFLTKVAGASVLSLRSREVLKIEPKEVSRLTIKTDIPAATQPTTRAAKQSQVIIERRKKELVAGPPAPTTLAAAPSATHPATTEPAATQPAPPPPPLSIWELRAAPTANAPSENANDGIVDALLAQLSPLRAEKFVELSAAATQPSAQYTLEIQTAAAGGESKSYTIHFIDPGDEKPLVAQYNDLTFEASRDLLPMLESDFTPGAILPARESEHERPSFKFPRR